MARELHDLGENLSQVLVFGGRGLVCLNRVSLCSPGTGIVDQSGHELRDLMPVSWGLGLKACYCCLTGKLDSKCSSL